MVGVLRSRVHDRSNDQTDFDSPEDWYRAYLEAVRNGVYLPRARTRDELVLADEEGILKRHPEWIPGRQGLALLGLPSWFGRPVEPLPEKAREAIVAAMLKDEGFAAAVSCILAGGAV
ncbi:MAG TPA: hypothetical protein DC058_08360 [Planctomycetaceae bacterium]|nr:hypothetical protein [Planctomycetaceae bacterium]